jgi:hypothetical protein
MRRRQRYAEVEGRAHEAAAERMHSTGSLHHQCDSPPAQQLTQNRRPLPCSVLKGSGHQAPGSGGGDGGDAAGSSGWGPFNGPDGQVSSGIRRGQRGRKGVGSGLIFGVRGAQPSQGSPPLWSTTASRTHPAWSHTRAATHPQTARAVVLFLFSLCRQALLGQVDLAFLGTYAFGMFISGVLGDRYDLRLLLSWGMVLAGLMTSLTGLVGGAWGWEWDGTIAVAGLMADVTGLASGAIGFCCVRLLCLAFERAGGPKGSETMVAGGCLDCDSAAL